MGRKIKFGTDLWTLLSVFILGAYLETVFIASLMRAETRTEFPSVVFILVSAAISLCASYLLIGVLHKLYAKKDIIRDKTENIGILKYFGSGRQVFVRVTAVVFTVYFIIYLLNFPGYATQDTLYQIAQAKGDMQYSNWHPVLHTLLFFTIPLKLSGGRTEILVFLQVCWFSLAFGYLVYSVNEMVKSRFVCFVMCVYVWLNSNMWEHLMYPWKDLALMIFAMPLIAFYFRIIATKGAWIKSKRNILLFSLFAVLCTYMRHNAVLFVLPLVFIGLFYMKGQWFSRIGVIVCCTVMYLAVQLLYSAINVQSPDRRVVETIGLPMSIWCEIMKEEPEKLPNDVREIMYSFASKETYEKYPAKQGFNLIKFSDNFDMDKLDELSYKQVFDITMTCFRTDPVRSVYAFCSLTDLVWGIDNAASDKLEILNEEVMNDSEGSNRSIRNIVVFFDNFNYMIFGSYGIMMIVMLCVAAALFAAKRWAFVHIIPLFCYNFGTMLLLSGRDYRFFLLNIPLWTVTILIMLKDKSTFGKNVQKTAKPTGNRLFIKDKFQEE